jgi:hypothetical protein
MFGIVVIAMKTQFQRYQEMQYSTNLNNAEEKHKDKNDLQNVAVTYRLKIQASLFPEKY